MVVRSLWLMPISSSVLTITAYNLPHQPLAKAISSQILNVAALFFALTVYLRHRQIVEYYGNRLKIESRLWRPFSYVLLLFGMLASFAITLEANFFNTIEVKHGILGRLFATAALTYFLGQIAFGYFAQPPMFWPFLNHCRLFLCFGGMSAFFWLMFFSRQQGSPTSMNYNYAVLPSVVQGSVQMLLSSFSIELWFSYAHVPKLHFSAKYYNALQTTENDE
uniref:Cytochrome b561 domain-containing protein n=1 Tax=Steinernema glaseri TaxID=37863 RepID=A0A1I7YYK2_9BILA